MVQMPHDNRADGQTHGSLGALESALLQLNNGHPGALGSHITPEYPQGGTEMRGPEQQYQAATSAGSMANFNENRVVAQAISSDMNALRGSVGPEGEVKKKKGAASSATNDKELREMLAKNDGRSLRDVAAEVLATERTPRAEKTKQLFAMLW